MLLANLDLWDAKKYSPVPGWTEHCRQKYLDARSAFIKWVQAGKLRSGSVFKTMKNCRKSFVNVMKFVKKYRQNIEDDALARKYKERNSKEFWEAVNKRRGAEVRVDGQRNNEEIIKIFAEKFNKITGENNRIYDTDIFLS